MKPKQLNRDLVRLTQFGLKLGALFVLAHLASPALAQTNTEPPIESVPLRVQTTMFGGGVVEVACEIEGRASFCKLDFGVNMTSVKLSPETEHWPSQGKVNYMAASGQSIQCDLVLIPEFKIGRDHRQQMEAVRCPVVDGRTSLNIVGLDFFLGKRVNLSGKTQQLLVGGEPPVATERLRSFSADQAGHILIPFLVGHRFQAQQEILAMVDSGATLTAVSSDFVDRHPGYFSLIREFEQGRDTHGHILKARLMIASFDLGGGVAAGEYVMIIDFAGIQRLTGRPVEMILGWNIMKNFDWHFDFTKKLWWN